MAAKAWGTQQKAVDEVFFQNEAVSLCLLVNRRARTMRVIDFRAGPTTPSASSSCRSRSVREWKRPTPSSSATRWRPG